MKEPSRIDMNEVTRLTREGRLREAVALLQASVGSPAPTGASTQPPTSGAARDAAPATLLRGLAERLGIGRHAQPAHRPGPSPASTRPAGAPASGRESSGSRPAGARFELRTFANAAGSRAYRLYVPASYGGQPTALLVMLHGCTQTAEDFATGTRMNAVAESHGALVAYPEQSRSANPNGCWNWFSRADQRRDQGEPALIAGIAREVMRDFAVAPGRVYVAGLSAGGATAALMGRLYPELFAAVGVHSGLAAGAAEDAGTAFRAMRQGAPDVALSPGAEPRLVPTIVFHGDRDRTVSPVNGAQVIAQAGANVSLHRSTDRQRSADGVEYTRTVHCDPAGHPDLEHWVIHGAGHAWSGGDRAGSHTDPSGPDASAEMMRFFLQHAARTR